MFGDGEEDPLLRFEKAGFQGIGNDRIENILNPLDVGGVNISIPNPVPVRIIKGRLIGGHLIIEADHLIANALIEDLAFI